ncbi:MAG: type VI secretion system membrane subunit TssM [[Actinobacillus] rossii]|nr:type VI secretion system membrane subunit TssM [[Actinobacillus] rossii]MDY3123212.1 type VI secretion system membrane subunit TssM [[Actinobacillus] rossii]MDY4505550.1 type VI secretion system membrane subunit TssM [[Actinobacillus] rossii]
MKLPLEFKAFQPILSKIKNSWISILILSWVILLIFIWWKGNEFNIGEYKPFDTLESRWLATSALFIIAIIPIFGKVISRLRVLESRQQENKKKQHNPIQEEINLQYRYFEHWINKFKRYVNSQNYQYILPWYLILGVDKSGKKSLLKEGGNFAELYHLDEYYTELSILSNEKAVVICPSSHLILQQDEVESKPLLYNKLWLNMLSWVKEQRARQPLNGIILTVDFHRLLVANKEEKEAYIDLLHKRLDEVMDISQSELPIYIVMTKLDTFYGFEAIYKSLSKEQREAILGITFKHRGENWQEELISFWQNWAEMMNKALPNLLFKAMPNERDSIFSYVRQLTTAIDILSPFLEQLISNSGKSFHFFKGVYLVSTTQNGKIDNIFVQSASEQYHLGRLSYPVWSTKNTQSFFSYELLKNVIFNFPNLAAESKVWRRNYVARIKRLSIVLATLALGLVGTWHYFYYKNHQASINVLEQVKLFKNIKLSNQVDNYGDKQLPILNPLREAVLSYGDYHEKSYLFKDMGLYQGNFIGPYVEETYLKLLYMKYLPAIMNGLLIQLNEAPQGSEEKLEILRVMRMLDDKTGRDNSFVKEFMKKYWSKSFKGQKKLQDNLMNHLDYALQHTDWFDGRIKGDEALIRAYTPYELSVSNAQEELSRSSIYDRVYQNLKIKAASVLPAPLDYRDEIGSGFDDVFVAMNKDFLKVPRFFTENGMKNYFLKQDDHLVDLISMDSWVLNLKENLEYSEADREKMRERIMEQYLNDYISTWNSTLNNLDIKEFETLSESIKAIEKITGGEQTLKRALLVLSENTQSPELPKEEGKALQETVNNADYRLISQIDHNFENEKAVLSNADDKNGALQSIYQKLSDLHRYLLAIQNAPDSGKAALKAVQYRIDQKSTDPILELQQLAKTMPQPVSRWLEQIAEYTWQSVLKSAIASLEIEWNNKIIKPYRTYLKNRYPFSKNAVKEIPLSEFSRFFEPGGTLDKFYETNLKPFIENNLDDFSNDSISLIRPDVIEQLELARGIRDTFFGKGNGIGVQYTIEPLSLSGNNRRSILNLDGQIVDYSQGVKKQTKIIWPNSLNNDIESKLTLVSINGSQSPRSISVKGPWAQIKLLTSGKITNVKANSFDIRYDINDGYATYRIYIDESNNPFSWDKFKNFNLPDTLY